MEVPNRPTTCASLNGQGDAKLRLQAINLMWSKHALTYSFAKKEINIRTDNSPAGLEIYATGKVGSVVLTTNTDNASYRNSADVRHTHTRTPDFNTIQLPG